MNAQSKEAGSTIQQTVQDTPPIILSRYGDRVIQWQPATLQRVLTQLRSERHHIADATIDDLLAKAEHVKNNANNYIHEAGVSP